jgi:hypothetical protein
MKDPDQGAAPDRLEVANREVEVGPAILQAVVEADIVPVRVVAEAAPAGRGLAEEAVLEWGITLAPMEADPGRAVDPALNLEVANREVALEAAEALERAIVRAVVAVAPVEGLAQAAGLDTDQVRGPGAIQPREMEQAAGPAVAMEADTVLVR